MHGQDDMTISIGITTFENRFEKYFVPLLTRIREYDDDTEIIVTINGEHKQEFGEEYRSGILDFISKKKKVFPIVFPRFRSPSKMWNTIVVHATHDYVLILNDDIMITNPNFVDDIKRAIKRNDGRSFIINGSFSHYLVCRRELDEIGYFDERLLGIGEEDGDITWRYIHQYGRQLKAVSIRGFVNMSEQTMNHVPLNIKSRPGTKYSLFNRQFIYETKYERNSSGIKGMFDHPMITKDNDPQQYPHENFYRENRDKL